MLQLLIVERIPDATSYPVILPNGRLQLVKAVGAARPHRYLKRVPTGKAKPRWRYYYNVPGQGLVSSTDLVAGSKFKGEHEGQAGHYEVKGVDANGVTVHHSGSGKTQTLAHADFASHVNGQHAAAHAEKQGSVRGEIQEALRVAEREDGSAAQAARVQRLVESALAAGWVGDKEANAYMGTISRAKAKTDGVKTLSPEDLAGGGWQHTGHAGSEGSARQKAAELGPGHAIVKLGKEHHVFKRDPEAQARAEAALGPVQVTTRGKKDGGIGLAGAKDVMMVSNTTGQADEQPIKYRLVDARQVKASHIPGDVGRFRVNPAYPEGVQERQYHTSRNYQSQVVEHAKHMKPGFLVATSPDAANGAPIMTPDGVVLGGNSRTMSVGLAYQMFPESVQKYKQLLKDKAGQFGFSPDDVDGMEQPMLVREVADPGTKEGQIDLVRRYNESFTQAMDPREEQVAKAKRMGPKVFNVLADGISTGESLSAYMASAKSHDLIDAMMAEGVIDRRDLDKYVAKGGKKKGKLTEDGRTMVSRLLLGKFVPDADTLETLGPEMRESLAGAIPHMLAAQKANPEFDLLPSWNKEGEVQDKGSLWRAVEAYTQMKDAGAKLPSVVFKQGQLAGKKALSAEEHPVYKDKTAQHILATMLTKRRSLGSGFRKFAATAEANRPEEVDMFAPAPGVAARKGIENAFGFKTDSPIQEVEDKIAKQMAADADKGQTDDGSDEEEQAA